MFDKNFTVAAVSERGGTHVASLANPANLLAFANVNWTRLNPFVAYLVDRLRVIDV